MPDLEALMHHALTIARAGMDAGQAPFGCVIWRDGEVLAVAHNTVRADTDITAHAEVNALRTASRAVGSPKLEGAIVVTTCEPCPMCMSALLFAKVAEVHYGASIPDAVDAGFGQIHVRAAALAGQHDPAVTVAGGLLGDKCRALFDDWNRRDDGDHRG